MNQHQSSPHGLEPLLNIDELADYLGVPVSTIYDWRTNGKGHPAYRFGKRIMFGITDIRAWMDTMREPAAPTGAATFLGAGGVGRPRTPIGAFGIIATSSQPNGNHVARARYRDWDGSNRLVQATGSSRAAAERKLNQKLAKRSLYQPGFNGMSADSSFPELVTYWLEDMKIEDRLSRTTRNFYERDMRTLVLPAFKELTLREIGVARCDYFLKQLARRSYSRAKHARVVLRLALAARHEILPRNPMDHVSRLHRKKTIPDAFTIGEVHEIRAAIKAWESRRILAGPRPDRQLGQIVEVMLGTSARIGEVLAIRLQDLDLDGPFPTARIAGTIITRKGEPTHRQEHPKTDRSVRRVALPSFALQAIR
ncbi:helix-turn-helix domain-containing protein [Plantibacter sp. YIM 135347]|uniref:helix-turn-helix domain-containing protein n=1 Tax=Plantibacter sp. YIM 135347 TaxID=3423919 RepID=UPI003D34D176